MRADLAAALALRKAQQIADPTERIRALRQAVIDAEGGDFAAFTAAREAYERACLESPGAEPPMERGEDEGA